MKKKKDCRKSNVRVERVTPQLGNKRSQKEAGAVPENSGKRRCSGTVAIILDRPVQRQTKILEGRNSNLAKGHRKKVLR